MKFFISSLFLFASLVMTAQDTGSIVGKLIDKDANDDPLVFANVLIKGTTKGTTTDFDGLFEITNLTPGTYTVQFSYLGYETIEIENLVVEAGKATTVNAGMSAAEGVSLDEVVVTTVARKDSEVALLLDQKKAVSIKTAIGAQELARKGVSDVATAVTKTTGISKQEGGGGVFVRGLGDRYNVTTMNGLPLPSDNPGRKNIKLDIFSTDIVDFIGIDKTYSAENYGDFGGANIDIASKNYTGSGYLQVAVGSGVNSEAVAQNQFYLNDGPSMNGFYTKNPPAFPLNNYNFTTSWDRTDAPAPINTNISIKGGDSYQLGEESKLSFFAVGSFNNGYTYKEGVTRGSVTVGGLARRDYEFESYDYETNTTLMGNVAFRSGNNSLKYNSLFVNTSNQQQAEYIGTVDAFDYAPEGGAFVQRATFDRTSLFVNQLLGDHKITETFDVNWGVSYNTIQSSTPNRRQLILTPDNWDIPTGPKSFQETLNSSDNHRFYQDLVEDELAANLSATFKFAKNDDDEFNGKVKLGYSGRFKVVDFESTQFNFRIARRNQNGSFVDQPIVDDIYNADAYFNQANLNAGLFSIETFRGNVNNPNALAPQTYDGSQDIHAAFTTLEYTLNPKLSVVAGIRGELINQSIEWSTSLDPNGDESSFDTFEFLPSVAFKYSLNEKQNLKLAASKTYTLPQFKERALFQFEEVTQVYFGNPSLYASTDYNFDLKWELFPSNDQLISLGTFGKYIQNPINDVTVNSATNDISYVNTGDSAVAFGAELEVRKDIFSSEKDAGDVLLKTNLTAGFNASYMYSDQKLDGDKVVAETTAAGILPLSVDFSNENDKLTGASDLLVNADVSYFTEFAQDKNIQATLAYNYFSDRIFALGTEGKGNLVDQGFGMLDLVVKASLNKHMSVGFTGRNLLNPTINRVQEVQDVLVQSYKKGNNLSLSVSYTF